MRRARIFATTSALTAAAAVVGSLGTQPQIRVVPAARASPPGSPRACGVPPGVDPALRPDRLGHQAGPGRRRPRSGRRRLLALVGADLAVNVGWNWAFFARRSPPGGLAAIAVLNVLNLALVREAARRDRVGAAALAPYVAWSASPPR